MGNSIILIGPMYTGKSTLGELLTEKLNRTLIELDEIRFDYYAEIGYDADYAQKLREEEGFAALVRYWKPFEIHSVERLLSDYPNEHVISFGAGQSVYENEDFMKRAKAAFSDFPQVVLILPSADTEETFTILVERMREDFTDLTEDLLSILRHFITHPANSELATITIYNANQSPEETCEAIIHALKLS